jgi:hypothetical protein
MRDKKAEDFIRRQRERQERERNNNDKEWRPQQDGFVPDRR